jgi:hypothetical protein
MMPIENPSPLLDKYFLVKRPFHDYLESIINVHGCPKSLDGRSTGPRIPVGKWIRTYYWRVPDAVFRYFSHAAPLHYKVCTRYINSTE